MGHDVLVAPLLTFEPIRDAKLGTESWAGVLLTSANAARALAQHAQFAALKDLPLLTVGDRTAETARKLGFADVASAAGNVSNVARAAVGQFGGMRTPLLYAAAEDHAANLAEMLASQNLRVRTVAVYRMAKAVAFPPNVSVALDTGNVDGVLHYSPRSAEAYLACATGALREAALAPAHYCLSAEVAKPLVAAGTQRASVALRPDEGSLFDLLMLQ